MFEAVSKLLRKIAVIIHLLLYHSINMIGLFIYLFIFQLTSALTTIRSVNKTDARTLITTFGSFENILKASENSLALCPGIGPQKASRIYKILHQPFLTQQPDC